MMTWDLSFPRLRCVCGLVCVRDCVHVPLHIHARTRAHTHKLTHETHTRNTHTKHTHTHTHTHTSRRRPLAVMQEAGRRQKRGGRRKRRCTSGRCKMRQGRCVQGPERLRRCLACFVHIRLEARRRNVVLTKLKEAPAAAGRGGQRPEASRTLSHWQGRRTQPCEQQTHKNLGVETFEA